MFCWVGPEKKLYPWPVKAVGPETTSSKAGGTVNTQVALTAQGILRVALEFSRPGILCCL